MITTSKLLRDNSLHKPCWHLASILWPPLTAVLALRSVAAFTRGAMCLSPKCICRVPNADDTHADQLSKIVSAWAVCRKLLLYAA